MVNEEYGRLPRGGLGSTDNAGNISLLSLAEE